MRTVTLINALGSNVRHTIIATNGRYGAADRLRSDVLFQLIPPPPGKGRLWYSVTLARLLRTIKPDLLLTYNWGAIDAVIAGVIERVCPVLHGEDGFGPEEAVTLKRRRVLTRRLVLRRIYRTIVPSKVLFDIARDRFRVPAAKLAHIPNGVDQDRFRQERNLEWRRSHRIPDEAVLCGAVGALRPEKNLDLLIRAFDRAHGNTWLAVVGEGPCRADLEQAARGVGASARIIFVGPVADPAPLYRSLDIFAVSSLTEQMPLSVLEAMASGLPVLATDVGDIREMLGPTGVRGETLVRPRDLDAYADALAALALDAARRLQLGDQNRQRCVQRYALQNMIRSYRHTYESAIGRAL